MVSLLNRSRVYEDSFENAYDVGYSKRSDEVWEMTFSLPLNDRKADLLKDSAFKYIELEDKDEEYIGLYRILPYSITIDEEAQTISCTAYQVINTLMDSVILGEYKKENTLVATIIGDLLAMQKTAHWTLGLCEATDKIDVDWYNESGLIEPLYEILAKLDGKYVYTFQTKVYPWVLDLVKVATEPVCRIKDGHNLQNLTVDYDPSQMVNRVYPIGQDEDGEPVYIPGNYVQNETSVAKYGPIEAIYENSEIEDMAKLEDEAVKVLEASQDMAVEWSVKASDLIKLADARGIQPIDGRENIVLDSARAVDFSQLGDIETAVQDFEGRNLARNTTFFRDDYGWVKNGTAILNVTPNGLGFTTPATGSTPGIKAIPKYFLDWVENQLYTIKGTIRGNAPIMIGTNQSTLPSGGYNRPKNGEENWTYYSRTATALETQTRDLYVLAYRHDVDNHLEIKRESLQVTKGEGEYPYSPAPEDLTHATTYQLASPIEPNRPYSLSLKTQDDDWLGVWAGDDYFLGYVENKRDEGVNENLMDVVPMSRFISNSSAAYPIFHEVLGSGHYRLKRNFDLGTAQTGIVLSTYTSDFFEGYGTYTCSVEVKPDLDTSLNIGSANTVYTFCPANVWTTISFTREFDGNTRLPALASRTPYVSQTNNPWIEYRNYKVEKGPVTTPYVPYGEYWNRHVTSEMEVVDPRGENLFQEGQVPITRTTYLIGHFYLTEDLVAGETYTVSFKGDAGEGQLFRLHLNLGATGPAGYSDSNEGVFSITITPKTTDTILNRISFYSYPSTEVNTAEIEWVKVEKGPVATPYISAEDDRKTLILKSLQGTKVSHLKLEEGSGVTAWKRASSEVLPYPAIPTIDRLRLNQMVRIDVEGLGEVDMLIKGESKSDIYGAPEDIDLELDNGKKNEPYSMVGVHRSISDIRQKIDSNVFSVIARGREIATDLINSGHGGYVRYYPNRILIMDTEEEATATYVWQFNLNGIGHSQSGVNGPWKYAWTIDGRFNTDFIETGSITTNMISNDYGTDLLRDTNQAISAINDQIADVFIELGANNLLLSVQSAAGGSLATQGYVQDAVEAINKANPNRISGIPESWEQGGLNTSTGAETTSSTIIRSKAYYPIRAGAVTMSMNDIYEGIIYFYDDNYQYKSSSSTFSSLVTVTIPSDYRFRVAIRFKSGASIVPSAIDHVDLKVENAAEATAWTPYFGDLAENLQNDYFLLVLSSDNGWVVDVDNWTTTLRAHLFWYNDEVTTEHDAFNFVWYRQYPGQNRTAVGAGYTLQVSGSDLSKSATYTCEFLSTSIINLLTTRAGDTLMTRNNDNIMIIGDY